MHSFTVWAPAAARVDLDLTDGRVLKMGRTEGGWWRLDVEGAGAGTDYAFRVDGSGPTPDPRSTWQPTGVHGPSRVFDAAAHRPPPWPGREVRGAVLYELHVGTFTAEGTLDAAARRLGHLVDLGVDMVSLLPLAAFPGRHGWGYDGVHLAAVHEPYGGPAALQRFVAAAHDAGVAVCLDVVYNHLGPSGNYLCRYGPYFTDHHHTPWGPGLNLDGRGSAEVRGWVLDNAMQWFLDFGVDALRLDAVHELRDDSPVHLLAELSQRTAATATALGRPLGLVAESDLNDPRTVEPVARGGLGMSAQWSDDFHHALYALLSGERDGYYVDFGEPATLAHALRRVFVHDGGYSTFRGCRWGAPVDPARHRGHGFLAYAANHDQVGNRALGDRPGATLLPGQLAVAAALTLTSPFTPMLFMGEEWGAGTPWRFFTDHDDPELAETVGAGRRQELADHGWDTAGMPDPQDPASRDVSVLDWAETSQAGHRRLLRWHRGLISLRRQYPDLRDDDLTRVEVSWGPGASGAAWMVVRRGRLRVAVTLTEEALLVPLDVPVGEVLAAWDDVAVVAGGLAVPGYGVAVVTAR